MAACGCFFGVAADCGTVRAFVVVTVVAVVVIIINACCCGLSEGFSFQALCKSFYAFRLLSLPFLPQTTWSRRLAPPPSHYPSST